MHVYKHFRFELQPGQVPLPLRAPLFRLMLQGCQLAWPQMNPPLLFTVCTQICLLPDTACVAHVSPSESS